MYGLSGASGKYKNINNKSIIIFRCRNKLRYQRYQWGRAVSPQSCTEETNQLQVC